MAIENEVVDSPVDGDNPQPDTKVAAPVAQVPVPANNGWEAEKKAFIADLQKERKARQEYERQSNTYKTQYETEQKRVRALSGVDPLNPEEAEAADIRARFNKVMPREQLLAALGLDEDDIKNLKGSRESQARQAELETQHWDRHGREMMGAFQKEVLAELGGDKLTDRQTRSLISTFVQACNDNPELKTRYERGDTSVFKEFTQEWVEDWLKPAQRKSAAAEIGQRRPLPSGKDRSMPVSNGKKIDVTDDKAVEEFLAAGYRERGGRFRNE
jgi:hypothetical protein